MRWTFVASATMSFMWMGSSVLQAAGDTLTPMKAQIVSRIIHIALSPLLMFGWLGFEWGLAERRRECSGAVGGRGINFRALFTGTSRLHLTFRAIASTGHCWGEWVLWRSGLRDWYGAGAGPVDPGWPSDTLRRCGPAAYSLTNRVQMIANLGSMGVGQAAGIMVGQNLGAKKPERAKSAVLWALAFTTLLKGIVIGLIVAFPVFFLSIFSDDAELLGTAKIWLYIQAVGFFAMGASVVFMQSFQTAGDTMVPMVVTLISMWAVQQPLAIMLSGVALDWTIFGWVVPVPTIANLGQYGIAWAVVIAIAVRLLIYVPYFIWGPWTKKQVLGGGGRGAGMGMGMRSGH
jgi:Na+-driven multidrug efflux pump